MNLTFKIANESDCNLLTDTAKKSKKHWGYSDELIEQWHDDLAVVPESFLNRKIYKSYSGDDFIGFYVILDKGEYCELDGLWILPDHHGKGFGREMMAHAKAEATKSGYNYIRLYADPNVNGFYEKIGGELKGKKETFINDRYLNIYHFDLV